MIFNDNDVHELALVSWKEARGEVIHFGTDSIRAVMHVIVNRVGHPGFAHTLHDVIYGKNQFTSMSVPSDPEYNLMPSGNDTIFTQCIGLARDTLQGGNEDITKGACYYANLKTATSGWFKTHIEDDTVNHPVTATIGHHTFFK